MRIKLSKFDLEKLFRSVSLEKTANWKTLANQLSVSDRTIRDWRKGIVSMPEDKYSILLSLSHIKREELFPEILKDYWHIKEAAKKGGLERMKLYGDLGTPEGRKKGGLASIRTHFARKTGFKTLRPITKPKQSKELAELVGILFGDGHLSSFQVSVTTNSITDMKHALFIEDIFMRLFALKAKVSEKKGDNAVNVVVSSKNLVNFLNKLGMPIGNKIKGNFCVPQWILRDTDYQKAFIRGLFDTDGCIYLDKHKINGKLYKHLGWTITSYSPLLIRDVIRILVNLGFRPTYRTSQKSVFLRRADDILRYFSEVGSSNEKHLQRFRNFLDISKAA